MQETAIIEKIPAQGLRNAEDEMPVASLIKPLVTQPMIDYLPLYHPELNYQERLWHAMRYEETTNVYFETISDLDHAVFKRSQRWKPKKIKELGSFVNFS